MTQAPELKPCPFCGGDAEVIHIEEGENEGGSCVCCTVCMASSNLEFGFKENFVGNWNSRASAAPTDDALRVKPLEWEWDTRDVGDFWSAKTAVGEYEAGRSDDGYAFACCDGPVMWEWQPDEDARLLSIDDAKAAAQADYETRIRAALEDRT